MAICIAFKRLEIVAIKEASKQKGVPQVGCARKETLRVENTVIFSYFNGKRVGS